MTEHQKKRIADVRGGGGLEVQQMTMQHERDRSYLVALHIVKSLGQKGLLSDREIVGIDAKLAREFSPSLAARTPELACIR